jgi:hypothetical protein
MVTKESIFIMQSLLLCYTLPPVERNRKKRRRVAHFADYLYSWRCLEA